MLKNWYRVFYSTNGVLSDKSLLSNTKAGFVFTLPSTDYIYIGQAMPFNNIFAWMDVVNTNPATLTVQYWDGDEWTDTVDLLDNTMGFTQSGVIQFSPNDEDSWHCVNDTSESTNGPAELNSITVYDLYWVRIKSNATLSVTTKVKMFTYAFCRSEDLSVYEPEIDSYLEPWGGVSKTNWIEQIIAASEQVILDLKAAGLVVHAGQVLRFDDVAIPTMFKTLLLIYTVLGPAFNERKLSRQRDYSAMLSVKRFTFDKNKNGRVDKAEMFNSIGRLIR